MKNRPKKAKLVNLSQGVDQRLGFKQIYGDAENKIFQLFPAFLSIKMKNDLKKMSADGAFPNGCNC